MICQQTPWCTSRVSHLCLTCKLHFLGWWLVMLHKPCLIPMEKCPWLLLLRRLVCCCKNPIPITAINIPSSLTDLVTYISNRKPFKFGSSIFGCFFCRSSAWSWRVPPKTCVKSLDMGEIPEVAFGFEKANIESEKKRWFHWKSLKQPCCFWGFCLGGGYVEQLWLQVWIRKFTP